MVFCKCVKAFLSQPESRREGESKKKNGFKGDLESPP